MEYILKGHMKLYTIKRGLYKYVYIILTIYYNCYATVLKGEIKIYHSPNILNYR